MNAALLQTAFKVALPYDAYLATDAAKAGSWRSAEAQATVTGAQRELLSTFTRHMPVLVISGVWCGDCAQQGPMLQAIAKACDGSTATPTLSCATWSASAAVIACRP